ncbi:hypothetical protein [Polaribacter aestuariivivens]|uniref:hypothetical protein n=1 Tax=Polaribacter aestuariivivens TaxID=2304626 RepID=UPI003F495A17
MPPSGYSNKQSKSIVSFLESVSNSLKSEGLEFNLTPLEALAREIKNIDDIVVSEKFGRLSGIVLELTKWFYEEIIKSSPQDYDVFIDVRNKILDEVYDDILDIHVPTIKVLHS